MEWVNIDTIIATNAEKRYYISPQKQHSLTYSQVQELANHYCQFLTVIPDENVVFVRLESPHRMMPVLLACWHSGKTAAILPPDTPVNKLQSLARVIGAETVVTDNSILDSTDFREIIINDPDKDTVVQSTASLEITLDQAEQPAIILFSSGTTGTPKCVPLSIRNLDSNINAFAKLLKLSSDDTFLCSSPYWYAHGLYNSFITAFFMEATVIYPGILNMLNASGTLQAACDYKATVYHITPSMIPILNMIAKRKNIIPDFRYVISGTAKLEMEQKNTFETCFNIRISQQYGMTESLFMTINYRQQHEKPESVGSAVGCQLNVYDEQGHALKTGEIGEVAVKTDAAFGSYFNQNDETVATYRNGLFYTGDLGQIDADGYLTITGRKKEIIKKGGINISPYEIEKVICQIPQISNAVTVGLTDQVYGEEIYSVVELNASITEDEILQYCSEHLTQSHVPRHVFIIDKFPLTSSGKIARNELKSFASDKVVG